VSPLEAVAQEELERDYLVRQAADRAEQARLRIQDLHRQLEDENAILAAAEASIAHLERPCQNTPGVKSAFVRAAEAEAIVWREPPAVPEAVKAAARFGSSFGRAEQTPFYGDPPGSTGMGGVIARG
jgi:hypothetical protein